MDVSNLHLATVPTDSHAPVINTATPWLDLAPATALTDPSLSMLGGVSPGKWEGLTIGPSLKDASHLVLAGTDNDYSVSQDPITSVQFEVYFKSASGTASRIRRGIGTFNNCAVVNANGSLGGAVPAGFDTAGYAPIPGVLHAYKASASDLARLVQPRKAPN